MSDRSENGLPASPGLERDPGGDEPWLARGPWKGNAIALACQVDELRQLNKRLELMNLGLGAHNRHLERQLDETRRGSRASSTRRGRGCSISKASCTRPGRIRRSASSGSVACGIGWSIGSTTSPGACRWRTRVAKAGLKRTVRLARRIKARLRSRDSTPLALAPPPPVPEGDSALRRAGSRARSPNSISGGGSWPRKGENGRMTIASAWTRKPRSTLGS